MHHVATEIQVRKLGFIHTVKSLYPRFQFLRRLSVILLHMTSCFQQNFHLKKVKELSWCTKLFNSPSRRRYNFILIVENTSWYMIRLYERGLTAKYITYYHLRWLLSSHVFHSFLTSAVIEYVMYIVTKRIIQIHKYSKNKELTVNNNPQYIYRCLKLHFLKKSVFNTVCYLFCPKPSKYIITLYLKTICRQRIDYSPGRSHRALYTSCLSLWFWHDGNFPTGFLVGKWIFSNQIYLCQNIILWRLQKSI